MSTSGCYGGRGVTFKGNEDHFSLFFFKVWNKRLTRCGSLEWYIEKQSCKSVGTATLYLDSQCLCNWGLTSNVNIQWVSILAAKVSGIHHMVLLLMLCLLTVTACRIGQLMLIPPALRCVIFIQAPSSMFSRDRRPGQFNGGHWTSQWKRCIVSDHRGSRM